MKNFFESLSKTIEHIDANLETQNLAKRIVNYHMLQWISQEESWTEKKYRKNLALWQSFMRLVKEKYPDIEDPLGGE